MQADDFHFMCRGCKTVKCLQEQVNELTYDFNDDILMTVVRTRRAEVVKTRREEVVRTKSRGNVREKAGKKKKDGKRKSVQ